MMEAAGVTQRDARADQYDSRETPCHVRHFQAATAKVHQRCDDQPGPRSEHAAGPNLVTSLAPIAATEALLALCGTSARPTSNAL
jgi:hypothetical protein